MEFNNVDRHQLLWNCLHILGNDRYMVLRNRYVEIHDTGSCVFLREFTEHMVEETLRCYCKVGE